MGLAGLEPNQVRDWHYSRQ